MLGDTTVVVQRKSVSGGMYGLPTTTRSRTEHRRRLLTADEVMRLSEQEAIIRTGNRHPMKLAKMYYDEPPRPSHASALGPAQALELMPALE